MEYFNDEPKFLDPSDWNIASYNAHPIDQIEPVAAEASSYRSAALHCLQILTSVDRFMSRARDSRLAWTAVSSAIGLTSTNGLAEREIARQLGVTEQSLHRAMAKFTRLANLDPAGGLRALGQVRSNGGPALKDVPVP